MKKIFKIFNIALFLLLLCHSVYSVNLVPRIERYFDPHRPRLGSQINWSHSLADDFVACWLFNEQEGRILKDSSLNGNHASMNDMDVPSTSISGWWISEKGRVATFQGTDHVDTGNTFQGVFRSNFTITLWMKVRDGVPAANTFICGARHSGSNMMYMNVNAAGALNWYWEVDGTGVTCQRLFIFDDGESKWLFVAFVANEGRTGKEMQLYVNGEDIQSTDASGFNFADYDAPYNFFIGNRNNLGSPNMSISGQIASFYIYDRALTKSELRWLFMDTYAFIKEDDFIMRFTAMSGAVSPGQIIIIK